PLPPPPRLDRRPVPLPRRDHRTLHAPPAPVQLIPQPVAVIDHPEPVSDHGGDPDQSPPPGVEPGRRRPGFQHPPQLAPLPLVQLRLAPDRALGPQRLQTPSPPPLVPVADPARINPNPPGDIGLTPAPREQPPRTQPLPRPHLLLIFPMCQTKSAHV